MKSNRLTKNHFVNDKLEQLQGVLYELEKLNPSEEIINYLGFNNDLAFLELQEDLYKTESNALIDKLIDIIQNVIDIIKQTKNELKTKSLLEQMSIVSLSDLIKNKEKRSTFLEKKTNDIYKNGNEFVILGLRDEERFKEVNKHKMDVKMICDLGKDKEQTQVRRLSEVLRSMDI